MKQSSTSPKRKTVVVSSSDGRDSKGEHILTPTSILSYHVVENDDSASEIFEARAIDTVRFLMHPLWTRNFPRVVLPIQRLLDFVPLHPALIRHWIQSKDDKIGGLIFPRSHRDGESLEATVQVKKRTDLSPPSSVAVGVRVTIFRREVGVCADLQPFDESVWHKRASYDIWCHFYHQYAVVLEEESSVLADPRLPRTGICELFRRMMHTHFADFGFVCGKLWWDFGFGEMVLEPLEHFMFIVLTDIFVKYYKKTTEAQLPLPPLFNASTLKGSGQHICAKCMMYKLGSGKMMCCPCRQVYYCCSECQKQDWKVHRVVCKFSKKK